jgi:hypothetical protein
VPAQDQSPNRDKLGSAVRPAWATQRERPGLNKSSKHRLQRREGKQENMRFCALEVNVQWSVPTNHVQTHTHHTKPPQACALHATSASFPPSCVSGSLQPCLSVSSLRPICKHLSHGGINSFKVKAVSLPTHGPLLAVLIAWCS